MNPLSSVLAGILNKFASNYIENVDAKQMGFSKMHDCVLNTSGLNELGLPVKVTYGRIGLLSVTIPWMNLLKGKYLVEIQDLVVTLSPLSQVAVDTQKEEEELHQAKMKKVNEYIEALKKAMEGKSQESEGYISRYTQQMVALVLKNLEIHIQNIHIRYEDKVTNPGNPFVCGVTLADLKVVSTNENWKVLVDTGPQSRLHKIAEIDSLGVYWNSHCGEMLGELTKENLCTAMLSGIATRNYSPPGYTYVLGPLHTSARLRLNQKPETDEPPFEIPMVHLNIEMQKLHIGINKEQYCDIITLLNSLASMSAAARFRKYKPTAVSYKGYYSVWWKFAYRCIVEEEIRRRRLNWDWEHMKQYRKTWREYKQYLHKKVSSKPTPEETEKGSAMEKLLDISSLIIINRLVQLETKRQEKIAKPQTGWFSWLRGSSHSSIDQQQEGSENILAQLNHAMTQEEREQLYEAMGYQEGVLPTTLPENYVDLNVTFLLCSLEVELCNNALENPLILLSELEGVKVKVEQRKGANALKARIKIDQLVTSGRETDGTTPKIINTDQSEAGAGLLEVLFETNPLDKKCGQRLHIKSQPLCIIYDAPTINQVIEVFKLPSSSDTEDFQAIAGDRISNMKQKSVSGLQHAIDMHSFFELNINFMAPYLIVPYGGTYTGFENAIVFNLGSVNIHSIPRDESTNLKTLYEMGIRDEVAMQAMIEKSYDQIRLELHDVQLLMSQSDEDWKKAIKKSEITNMHILTPINLHISFFKCLITDDPRLPHAKITGELPKLNINLSDARLLLLLSLVNSIPMPSSEEDLPVLTRQTALSKSTSQMSLKFRDIEKPYIPEIKEKDIPQTENEDVQFTTVEAKFVVSEFQVTLEHQENIKSVKTKLLTLQIERLECGYVKKTFVMSVDMGLGKIGLTHFRPIGNVNIISTPTVSIEGSPGDFLFRVNYLMVDRKYSSFHSIYKSCESLLELKFATLSVILNQDALCSLIAYCTDLQAQVNEIFQQNAPTKTRVKRTVSTGSIALSNIASKMSTGNKQGKRAVYIVETIKLKLLAELKELSVEFNTDQKKISLCAVKGIKSEIITKTVYTQVKIILHDLVIIDLNPATVHDMILSVIGNEAMNVQVVMYNFIKQHADANDMEVKIVAGGLRICFVNWFVSNMLNFLNQFQAAQQKIIETSQAAAETARQNVQNIYQKATKISLDIKIKAPDIIVPVNSKSYDAVLLDLGHIIIYNKFHTLDIKNEEGNPAIIENMKINLTDFKMSRIRLDPQRAVICELCLLQPMSFKLAVKRNLSASWYKAIPDLDVSGQLQHLELAMSQADYQMVMKTLSENLSEGKPEVGETAKVVSTQTTEASMLELNRQKSESSKISSLLETTKGDIDLAVHTFLRFTFSMDKFIIRLYSGGAESLTMESSECRDDNGLGQFSLEGLSIKGRILTDNSIVTSVLLVNCLLDDIRKGREEKLNRLIERKHEAIELDATNITVSTDSLTHPRSMLDVTFQMKDNTMFVDVRVYSFTLILSMEYLMKIADFFTNMPEKKKSALPKLEESTSKVVIKSRTEIHSPQESSTMNINLKIEKPDIILVEHMDNIDTNAIMLHCQVLLKVRMSGSHQVITGSVNELEVFACCYNPDKRSETRCEVFHPATISLAGSTPDAKGLHVEVIFSDIRLSVTPYIIELLNKVLAAMSKRAGAEEEGEAELPNYENLWVEKPYEEQDFWFLKPELASEATEEFDEIAVPDSAAVLTVAALQELCIISMPSIKITVEVGAGNKTIPMLLVDSSFKGNVRNWGSQLSVDAALTLQMGYYNSALAMWEPLVEPVEVLKQGKSGFIPWEIRLELAMSDQDDQSVASPTSEEETQIQQPIMSIDVVSENNLELTVTKTFLEILTNLGKAFSNAISEGLAHQEICVAPYKVVNHSGESIELLLSKSSFCLYNDFDLDEVVLENYAEVPIVLQPDLDFNDTITRNKSTKDLNVDSTRNYSLHVKMLVEGKYVELELPVVRADKRFFLLNYRGEGNDNWGLISEVKIDSGVTIITLRSILQVYNHFSIPVELYYMTSKGDHLKSIDHIEPGGVVNVPLKAVYTPTKELFFSVDGYTVSSTPYVWKDLQTDLSITKLLQCLPKCAEEKESFLLKAVGEMEQVYFENTARHTMASTCYNIHLRPAVTLKNLLPLEIVCCVENMVEEKTAEAGETLHLPNIEPGKSTVVIRMPNYAEKEWSCRLELHAHPPEFSVVTFSSHDSAAKMSIDLGLHIITKAGSMIASLYCPFWMLNKTNLMLAYRKSKKLEKQESSGSPAKNSEDNLNILHHPPNFKGPILFSFHAKNFFGKKKAAIRIENGEWSDKFSLDVAGSSGVVTCKDGNRVYQVGVHNQLTYNTFTKQVTFTPYYVIINNAPFEIECQESDRPGDPWTKVEATSCAPLWPYSDKDDKLLRIRVVGTEEVSAPFLYTESHTTMLKLNNKYGGINVDIQITEGGFYINIAHYEDGMAPALVINHTRHTMRYWEKQTVQVRMIRPNHCVYYTWENPSGPRIFVWEIGDKKDLENDLRKDGVDEYTVAGNTLFWVSFLYGMQRVLLFTENRSVAENAQSAKHFELIQQEITVSFHGLGLSLVNNEKRREVMYLGIASSGIIWETRKMNGRRYKPLPQKESNALEATYQKYLVKVAENPSDTELGRELVDSKTDVDFKLLQMYKPHKRIIRRTFQTGLWVQLKTSPTQLQLHGKINRLQIDNQMYDCTFPIMLAPVPPPKSVAIDSGMKPFAEVSIVQLLIKNSQIKQFKYFKVLIQEFHVKVDLGFVNAILETLQASEKADEEERELFLTDMKLADMALYSHVSTQSLQEQKSFYDLLHFSPLKIHISFSMASGSSSTSEGTPNFLNVILQGLGVTLTDMQDVVFKLAYFEREYTFLTRPQLTGEVTSHYVGQLVKQLYVLVLGLDVIGNPYGLVLGISKGVEDLFYEPFQGAIQGPGEFAEGLVLGVRSLFGHTVGGAAGAVSRITGAMGKGIAALTFDKDYQRKRRDQLNKRPATVQEGIARSGKGLVMGVVDGVTGVFTKPVAGAKEEGVGGFFKGLGKGAVGLVVRPTAGVIDFASGSLDAVKRATEVGEDTMKLRPPRFLHADGLVRPFMRLEAEGNKLLTELEKGKYATTDLYCAHYVLIEKKDILLLTDKRLALITHNDIFGGWQVDWSFTWKDLQNPVRVVPKGIAITLSEPKKKKLGVFGTSETSKLVLVSDPAKREEICMKIESLRGSS